MVDFSFLDNWSYSKRQQGDYTEYRLQSNKWTHEYILFLVGNGFTAVTGDYSNHIFCREFNPSKSQIGISFGYMLEKYRSQSTQNPTNVYSIQDTKDAIKEFRLDYVDGDLSKLSEEEKDAFDDLLYSAEDELDYTFQRYRGHRDDIVFLDCEVLDPVYDIDIQVQVILNAFITMCKKENETDTKT